MIPLSAPPSCLFSPFPVVGSPSSSSARVIPSHLPRFQIIFSPSNCLFLCSSPLSLSLIAFSASNRTWQSPSESGVIHKPINSDNKFSPRVIYPRSLPIFGEHLLPTFFNPNRFVFVQISSSHLKAVFPSHTLNGFNPLAAYGVPEGCALSERNNRFTRLRGFAMSLFPRSTLDWYKTHGLRSRSCTEVHSTLTIVNYVFNYTFAFL